MKKIDVIMIKLITIVLFLVIGLPLAAVMSFNIKMHRVASDSFLLIGSSIIGIVILISLIICIGVGLHRAKKALSIKKR